MIKDGANSANFKSGGPTELQTMPETIYWHSSWVGPPDLKLAELAPSPFRQGAILKCDLYLFTKERS